MKKLKVGDKVRFGEAIGRVVSTDYANMWPINVSFEGDVRCSFTDEGNMLTGTVPGMPKLEFVSRMRKVAKWVIVFKPISEAHTYTLWASLFSSKEEAEACARSLAGVPDVAGISEVAFEVEDPCAD